MVDFRSCLITIGVVGLCLFGIPININDSKLSEHKLMFQSYTKKFNKHYMVNSEEYELRFKKFQVSHTLWLHNTRFYLPYTIRLPYLIGFN